MHSMNSIMTSMMTFKLRILRILLLLDFRTLLERKVLLLLLLRNNQNGSRMIMMRISISKMMKTRNNLQAKRMRLRKTSMISNTMKKSKKTSMTILECLVNQQLKQAHRRMLSQLQKHQQNLERGSTIKHSISTMKTKKQKKPSLRSRNRRTHHLERKTIRRTTLTSMRISITITRCLKIFLKTAMIRISIILMIKKVVQLVRQSNNKLHQFRSR